MKADKASKRPWKVYKTTLFQFDAAQFASFDIADAEDRGVFRMDGPRERCEANVKVILDAVNGREALVRLVRRFMGIVNNQAPLVTAMAIVNAEMPEDAKDNPEKAISEGYKRLSALMREAYDATGEEDEP